MRHSLRCTQLSPIWRHSSHPSALGSTSSIWSRCVHSRLSIRINLLMGPSSGRGGLFFLPAGPFCGGWTVFTLDYDRRRDRAREGGARGYEHRQPERVEERVLYGGLDLLSRLPADAWGNPSPAAAT